MSCFGQRDEYRELVGIAMQLCLSEQAAGAQRSCVGRSLGSAGSQGRSELAKSTCEDARVSKSRCRSLLLRLNRAEATDARSWAQHNSRRIRTDVAQRVKCRSRIPGQEASYEL